MINKCVLNEWYVLSFFQKKSKQNLLQLCCSVYRFNRLTWIIRIFFNRFRFVWILPIIMWMLLIIGASLVRWFFWLFYRFSFNQAISFSIIVWKQGPLSPDLKLGTECRNSLECLLFVPNSQCDCHICKCQPYHILYNQTMCLPGRCKIYVLKII